MTFLHFILFHLHMLEALHKAASLIFSNCFLTILSFYVSITCMHSRVSPSNMLLFGFPFLVCPLPSRADITSHSAHTRLLSRAADAPFSFNTLATSLATRSPAPAIHRALLKSTYVTFSLQNSTYFLFTFVQVITKLIS